jgi:hypothetical protein
MYHRNFKDLVEQTNKKLKEAEENILDQKPEEETSTSGSTEQIDNIMALLNYMYNIVLDPQEDEELKQEANESLSGIASFIEERYNRFGIERSTLAKLDKIEDRPAAIKKLMYDAMKGKVEADRTGNSQENE